MGLSVSSGIPQWIFIQTTAPTSTYQGQLWVDTTTNPGVLYQSNAALSWVKVVTSPTVQYITTGTQGSDSTTFDIQSLDFSGYNQVLMLIEISGTNGGTLQDLRLTFNNDSSAVYNYTQILDGTKTTVNNNTFVKIGQFGGGSSTYPNRYVGQFTLFNPTGTDASKKFIGQSTRIQAQDSCTTLWCDYYKTSPVSAITRITIASSGVNQILTGSKVYFYGYK